MTEAEKQLVSELGDKICIYPKVCLQHAQRASVLGSKHSKNIDWDDIFR